MEVIFLFSKYTWWNINQGYLFSPQANEVMNEFHWLLAPGGWP
jgi:hypothetical protein